MQSGLLHINKNNAIPFKAEASLTFKPFIEYIRKLSNESSERSEFYRYVIKKFEEKDALNSLIDINGLTKYNEVLDLIYMIVNPMIYNEAEHFWALSTPVPGEIFYGTNGFYNFLSHQNPINFDIDKIYRKQQIALTYKVILERFYNIPLLIENNILYEDRDSILGITRYFQIHTDTQFLDIQVKGELPELNYEQIEAYLQDDGNEEFPDQLLPLSLFKFEGFSIITLSNVTAQHALENIKDMLANHAYENIKYNDIFQSLKTLAGISDIEFGLLPFLKVNDKAVYLSEDCAQSIIMNSAKRFSLPEDTYNSLVNQYQNNPRSVIFNTLSEESQKKHPVLQILNKAGISSYALIPVFYHKQLTGILEIYSTKPNAFDQKVVSRIHPAIPLVAQLLKYSTEEFNLKIETIIKDKFTPIKPSVQWKFNQVAWQYLKETHNHCKHPEIGTISFDNVYPLYGAIDVRNSTIERNAAIHEDISNQLDLLNTLYSSLQKHISYDSKEIFELDWESWTDKIQEFLIAKDETTLIRFLDKELNSFLLQVKAKYPETGKILIPYFDSVSETNSSIYKNRLSLETSLQLINSRVNEYLENAQKELQLLYPHYFEKFRTDGIEYDIYIGQSITPNVPFEHSFLQNIRLWQLKSMAAIVRITKELLHKMLKPLQTTQLIFIHSNPIDISFRNDEKRFDVEGTYSIRYEVIKKRIDKVLVKGSNERLTQPEKIALVYFNPHEAKEYLQYITTLQQEGWLHDQVEFLELEELQGVSGLKAIRVRVKM